MARSLATRRTPAQSRLMENLRGRTALSQAQIVDYELPAYVAVDAFATNTGTEELFSSLVRQVMLCHTLSRVGVRAESDLLGKVLVELDRAFMRASASGQWKLTEDELMLMKLFLGFYTALLPRVTLSHMLSAHNAMSNMLGAANDAEPLAA